MNTTHLSGYSLPQKLYPVSLLGQLTKRHVTGCLRVSTQTATWSINLEDGKLTYASYSEKLFDRLDDHLQRLSQKATTIDTATRVQMRLMFESKNQDQSMQYPDYQAINWLVKQQYITSTQAETLIRELAQEVLETFLLLREGNYEFYRESTWDKLPKFCHLDLQLLVEHCQKQLANRKNIQPQVNGGSVSSVVSPTNSAQVSHSQPIVKNRLYTIVCIDDSQTVLKSIELFLDSSQFSVVTIKDPVKALMQILRSKPDLILLDVEMPNLDGYELCSLLRRHSALKDTPIIMVTGRTGFIDKAKAKMVRSSGYLTKPFTQQELLKMMFKYLD
ncbi:response regulator [Nodularia harveyana UHCC-0300]|uniref:Response regulator n=1 Tax=Nodularia harveyana UHCC-0300 TaxID=2974287 RepID=A0ABU5UE84_9CYAN|nr:response regulator [Nodularia harveyana]MEA5581845.1 response regulator [Nodularia harveyana UHCC-0300]